MATITPQNLEAISTQYQQLNAALETLNKHNSYDLYVRAGTVLLTAISVFVAFRLFYLNRNKDFRLKKAEIAAEIYSRFFDYKKQMLLVLKMELEDAAHHKLSWDAETESQINAIYNAFTKAVDKNFYERDIKPLHNELDLMRRDLLRYIGQARFYVGNAEKTALKFHTNALIQEPWKRYSFTETSKTENLLYTFQDRIREAMNTEKGYLELQFNAIETILENYNKYVKTIHIRDMDEPNA